MNGGLGKWDYAIVASHNNGVSPGPQTYNDNTIHTASHGMQLWAVNDLHAHHNKLFGPGAGKGIYLRWPANKHLRVTADAF